MELRLRPGLMRVVEVELARVDVSGAAELFDADERTRAERFVRQADRDRYVAAHVAFRRIVGACLGVTPGEIVVVRRCLHCGDPVHGKPRVQLSAASGTAGVDVSLSHAGGLAVVAVVAAPAQVGVDVEQARPDLDWSELLGSPCPDPRTGLRRWTRAEAVLKAAGLGLVVRPEIGGSVGRDGWRAASVPGSADPWFVRDVPCVAGEEYAVSVATDAPGVAVELETWPHPAL